MITSEIKRLDLEGYYSGIRCTIWKDFKKQPTFFIFSKELQSLFEKELESALKTEK